MKALLLAVLMFSACGCTSILARCGTYTDGVTFIGTKLDYGFITDDNRSHGEQIYGILDMPFSLILDTLLYPTDAASSK